ncbi:hypothetical protein GW17_00054266 [Ensete ventricosum]|nr:hypothetical protein GW17_00054266 [Ensete ventricosum]
MHPLRFPNSGIRAKRLLAGEGRPHACCLYAEVAGHGQAPCRGDRPWPGYLQGAAGYGHAPCKGQPATARPPTRGGHPRARPTASQPPGAVGNDQPVRTNRLRPARKGLPPTASPTANRGDIAGHRSGRPLAGRLPTAKGSRRLRRGSGESNIVRVKEG